MAMMVVYAKPFYFCQPHAKNQGMLRAVLSGMMRARRQPAPRHLCRG